VLTASATAAWLAAAAAVLLVPAPAGYELRLDGRAARVGAGAMIRRPVGATRLIIGAAALVLGGGALVWRGPVLAAAVLTAGGAVSYAAGRALRQRHLLRATSALLAAVRLMAAELSSGSLEPDALLAAAALAGPLAPVLSAAGDCAAAGDLPGAAARLADEPLTVPLAAAWQVRAQLGVPLASALNQVERDLHDRLALARTVGEILAGPRASAVLLAGFPLVGIALGTGTGAHPLSFLTGHPVGRMVLLIGAVLDAVGLCWSVRLAAGAESAMTA
jgi:tight adherence protein B